VTRTWVAVALALLSSSTLAERLPVQSWSAQDGLGHDHVRCAFADRQEFLWFCTAAGLVRFDGSRFQRFGVADGLPQGRVLAALQTGDGAIWAGTERGLWRLDPRAGSPSALRFEAVGPEAPPPGAVHALALAPDGSLLVAGAGGVSRATAGANRGPSLEPLPPCPGLSGSPGELSDPRAIVTVADGSIWVGGENGRLRGIAPQGRSCVDLEVAEPGLWVRALLVDHAGRLWIGSDGGLARLDSARAEAPVGRLHHLGRADGFEGRRVRTIFEAPDGDLWVGAVGGLHRRAAGAFRFRHFTMAQGLPDETVNALVSDRHRQLWLATDTGGIARWVQAGFVSYDRTDGLGHDSVGRLFEDAAGGLIVGGEVGGWISRFDGERFTGLVLPLPAAIADRVAASPTWALEDRAGEWWLATVGGLLRYARPASFERLADRAPIGRLGRAQGLPSDWTFRLHESPSGELWIATAPGGGGERLARLSSDRRGLATFGPAHGLPATGGPNCFADGLDGGLWVGWSDGSILSFRDGRFESAARVEGFPVRELRRSGEVLWIATGGAGVYRLRLGRPHGEAAVLESPFELPHADIRAIDAEASGRLWLATTEGVVEVAPDGDVRRHARADGLASLEATSVLAARNGGLWVGTYAGVSRRAAGPAPAPIAPAPLAIGALEIDGVIQPVPPLGARSVGPIALGAGRHRVRIGWMGPSFRPGERLRARHRVLGLDERWSEPTEELSLTLAGREPGSYRFEVVPAELSAGDTAVVARAAALQPAVVEWTIARPFWSRAWFLALACGAVAAAALLVHRARVAHLLEIERVRSRIAGDLHDDLSASLTRISILSEVAARRTAAADHGASDLLRQIGSDARGLLDSTRDLVWAIDPRDATLGGVATRLRSFLDGLLDPGEVAGGLELAGPVEREPLDAERRRHLLLLLKEAIHNAVRHSGAKSIRVRLAVDAGGIGAEVADDGRGFDPETAGGSGASGRGLPGLAARARAMGATLEIDSAPGAGARIRCRLPRR
jgi:signal transduction histidine kinase/ligand-binding sensor domain-containing protein